jgi:Uma2 family endonuclease
VTRTADALATAEDLLSGRYGEENSELEEGVLLLHEPAGWAHGVVVYRVCAALSSRVADWNEVAVAAGDPGFWLTHMPDTVRAPDVAVISGPDAAGLEHEPGFARRPPDLAIEVRSPSDTLASQLDKARMWTARGVRLVWVIDPGSEAAYLLTPGAPLQRISMGGSLSAEPVLPGVTIPLDEVLP